ncbi:5357_t:CDS:2 [Gigaspora rosea]|nr:5357_t:CDS:2 [Gigaspora rosea]
MINKVELYYRCHVQPIKIIHLLENEYPDHPIKPRRIPRSLKNNASDLIHYLLQQQKSEPGYIVEPIIGDIDNELMGLFWQSDEQVQLLLRFGEICLLDTTLFNAGIQSTQCVESHNNLIKASVNQSSSLITLYKTIQERLDKESMYSRSLESINFDYNTGRVQSISRTLFPEIVTLCEKYLTPLVMAEIKQQIQQTLWYRCYPFNILQEHCTDEPEFSEFKISTKKFLQDRIKYGKSYGLLQTALTLAMETETNKELDQLCYQFIQQKKELKKEISKASEDYNDQENAIQVTNPIAITPRGRPSKRQKSAMELNDKQPLSTINENLNQSNYEQLNLEENLKQSYICLNCHIKGHNIRSCNLISKG